MSLAMQLDTERETLDLYRASGRVGQVVLGGAHT
jgi:hypothetical protein